MAALFQAVPTSLTEFTEGSGVYQDTASGQTVSVATAPGGGNALKVVASATSAEVGVRFGDTSKTANSVKFDFYLPADPTASLGSNQSQTIASLWADDGSGGYSNGAGGTGAYMTLAVQSVSGTNYPTNAYKLALTNPQAWGGPVPGTKPSIMANQQYITLYTNRPLARATWYTFEVRQTKVVGELAVYINNFYAGSFKFLPAGLNFRAVSLGKFYGTAFSGTMWFRNIALNALPVASPSTPALKLLEAYNSWVKTYIAPQGHPLAGTVIRPIGFPYADGQNYGYDGEYRASDWVSEGQAYGMRMAVSFNDQANFDLMETARYTRFRRANVLNSDFNYLGGIAPNLMGFHWFDDTQTWQDANAATDAEMDTIYALLTAHIRWGSAGTINYLSRALAAATDLRTYCFRDVTSGGTTYKVMTSDLVNGTGTSGPNPFETNPSYYDPMTFELLKTYDPTNSTFWQAALDGTYAYLPKTQAKNYSGGTGNGTGSPVGLFPEWAGFTSDFQASTIGSRDYAYSYNAFRTPFRLAWHYLITGNTSALNILTGSIRTFFQSQYSTNGDIKMEYKHDGTFQNTYEKSMGTLGAYMTQRVGTATPVAATMFNTKLADTFKPSANGGFYADNPSNGGGYRSYFDDSWMIMGLLAEYGTIKNSAYFEAPALAGSSTGDGGDQGGGTSSGHGSFLSLLVG